MAGPNSDPAAERLPPHNLEAERSVLGAILLEPGCLDAVLQILKLEDFFHHPHRLVFGAMVDIYTGGSGLDVVSLANHLRQSEKIEEIGGSAFLIDLAAGVPTVANVGYHAGIVREKSLLRQLIRISERVSDACQRESGTAQELVEWTERAVVGVIDQRLSDSMVALPDIIGETIAELERRAQQPDALIGVPTGFRDLDRMTGGLAATDLVILAARPSMGKTSLGLNIAASVAIDPPSTVRARPCVIFSLEMSRQQIAQRLLAMTSSVEASKIRSGRDLDQDDWDQIVAARGILGRVPLYIDDTPGLRVLDILARCRRLARREPLGLVMVDYLQLMTGDRGENRQQEVADISRGLKALAKELSVPVLALSQLSRAVEQRTDRRPQLADLRESGAIEQDADVVMFLYRPDPTKTETLRWRGQDIPLLEGDNLTELIVAKQRNGPTGSVLLHFRQQLMRFFLREQHHEPGPDRGSDDGAPDYY